MMKQTLPFLIIAGTLFFSCATGEIQAKSFYSENLVFPGWYADPEEAIFGDAYWIYSTFSGDYGEPKDTSIEITNQQRKTRKNAINQF